MGIACSISVVKFSTMPRPYSNDLRWRMIDQRYFYNRSYEDIASQLFVCPKTVYRTVRTFLNTSIAVVTDDGTCSTSAITILSS